MKGDAAETVARAHVYEGGQGGLFGAPKMLDSQSVLEVYGAWKAPDDEAAQQKYFAAHLQHQTFDPNTAEVLDFKEFGAGHLLYFYWLRFMAIVFGVLAVLPGIPMIVINLGGGFLATGSMDIEGTTIGNFGLPSTNANISNLPIVLPTTNSGADAEVEIVAYFQLQADVSAVVMDSLGFNKLNALVTVSVLDLIGILFFFGACIYFSIKTKVMAKKVDEQVTSLPDYSVAVMGLPADVTPEELQKHFEQWGEVVQVSCARKCNTLISLVLERRKVLDELDTATAVLQRSAGLTPKVDDDVEMEVLNAKYDLSLLTEAIQACQAAQGGADVVRGYVTYKDDIGRDAALAAQPQNKIARLRQPKTEWFRGQYQTFVRVAPEATDIYFENLEFTETYRWVARTITWCLKGLLVLCGFVLVSMAPSIKRNVAGDAGPNTATCDANCIWRNSLGQLYLNSTLRSTYKTCHDTGTYSNAVSCQGAVVCYECFCRAALGASMYQEATYCSDYSAVLMQAAGAQALTVATIVIVNFCVKRMIKAFTSSEKHRTRTREGLSMLTALFVTQFINTAFSIIIANIYLPSIKAALPGGFQKVLFGGVYSDTSPNWYREVGKALIVSHIISIPIRVAIIGIDILVVKWCKSRRSKALTQAQLEKCYEGHAFELAERYGELMSTIFVGLVFSAGMPLMYWSLGIMFLATYNLERFELLRICKWPISYSSHLGEKVAQILPWAALWHLLGAVWMLSMIGAPRSALFGNSFAFSIVSGLCSALSRLWTNTTQLSPEVMAARLTNQAVGHLLWGFVLLGLGMFLAYTWPTWHMWYQGFRARMEAARLLAEQHREEQRRKQEEEDDEDSDDEAGDGEEKEEEKEVAKAVSPVLIITPAENNANSHSVPEFALAVRSKLLVGPETYDMRKNPNYSYAFERMEDVLLGEELMDAVEKREQAARSALPSARAERRRMRRERARAALLSDGNKLGPEGQGGQHFQRLRSQEDAARRAGHGGTPLGHGKVVPWAGADGPLETAGGGGVTHDPVHKINSTRQAAELGPGEGNGQYGNHVMHAHDHLGEGHARAHGSRLY